MEQKRVQLKTRKSEDGTLRTPVLKPDNQESDSWNKYSWNGYNQKPDNKRPEDERRRQHGNG